MIEDMEDKGILDKARMKGIRQGIWLCIQKLVSLENLGMARYFILSFRFDKNECEALLDKNDPNDKMNEFIDGFIFNRNNHIKKVG